MVTKQLILESDEMHFSDVKSIYKDDPRIS